MHNPHSMYLLGKSIQADRLKAAEQRRLANLVRSKRADEPTGDSGRRLGLSLAARTAIVIALAVVLNIAG